LPHTPGLDASSTRLLAPGAELEDEELEGDDEEELLEEEDEELEEDEEEEEEEDEEEEAPAEDDEELEEAATAGSSSRARPLALTPGAASGALYSRTMIARLPPLA
jgi:hypothetical protein